MPTDCPRSIFTSNGSTIFESTSGEIAGGGGGSTLTFTCGALAVFEFAAEQATNSSAQNAAVATRLNAATGRHQSIHAIDRGVLESGPRIARFPDHIVSGINSDVVNGLHAAVV
ncbi:unannotated protein [freshwater metagenome]|uniref:Unannotated protein n=1 Tax=freshwater metagenome TaxID=449393 RepID=A0A6J7SNM3_9ZZZZ